MIQVEQLLELHSWIVEKTGGADGLRDRGALESAVNRPYATFDGIDLYPTEFTKAAAILESILINQPFVDGNKRTGIFLARILLMEEKFEISASEDEKYNFVISIAEGKLNTDQIGAWIRSNTSTIVDY